MSDGELARIGYEASVVEIKKRYPLARHLLVPWSDLPDGMKAGWFEAVKAIRKQIELERRICE
jgi:hypothetical protein